MVWSGDVDLNDSELREAYQLYWKRLESISEIGVKSKQTKLLLWKI